MDESTATPYPQLGCETGSGIGAQRERAAIEGIPKPNRKLLRPLTPTDRIPGNALLQRLTRNPLQPLCILLAGLFPQLSLNASDFAIRGSQISGPAQQDNWDADWYDQLQAVRRLETAARAEGPGHNYLVEHSAGSGKSNTIGWLAHRLASLHNTQDQRVFDTVIVVTDRVVLDQQLQDTIYQFEHKQGVVQKVDESSRQLAEALESAVPIVITTVQKFPFVSRQLLKLAEQRGEKSSGVLPTRRCAVIIDEAHSSQSGETATDLKEVLGGEELQAEAKFRAEEEGMAEFEELFRSMAKRGRQANLSFFAFTATPKHKTFAVFGRNGEPFHRYTMRQAIEEGSAVNF